MDLKEVRLLIAAQYSAPYEGNFIASLKELKNRIVNHYHGECAFVFPSTILSQPWATDFMATNKVFLTKSIKDVGEIQRMIEEYSPSLIYTHFEGYDTIFHKALKRSDRYTRIVWHMHDTLDFQKNKLKAAYQVGAFFLH